MPPLGVMSLVPSLFCLGLYVLATAKVKKLRKKEKPGASSGIGRGTAVYFANLGSKLVLNGRNEERLKQTKDMCVEQGLGTSDVACVVADIGVETERERLVDTAIKAFHRLDVLINCAGIAKGSEITSLSEEDFLQCIKINVTAPFRLVNLALPHLKSSKGNIVNVSSVVSVEPNPAAASYCMSKAALDCYTKNLALGYVLTHFLAHNTDFSKEEIEKFGETVVTKHPLGGNGNPEDIAKSIAVLASDLSSYVTGQIMFPAGGRNIKML